MKRSNNKGLTLVEMLISISIMGIITVAASSLLLVCLRAHAYGTDRTALYREGLFAMERMTVGARNCTFLLIPNARNPVRSILAFSGTVNDDNDFYFDDPLFPRIDEDTGKDMNNDEAPGIAGVDDDGDGLIDEEDKDDDDEDDHDVGGGRDEDKVDGLDNDGDGNIDEDFKDDMNGDGKDGLKDMDDDGDGGVDEGDDKDDDEDGVKDEDPLNPVLYSFDSGANTLSEALGDSSVILSSNVSAFSATYEAPDATHDPRILISLTMTDANSESITFSEYVYPRNITQKTGKKVR